MLTPDHYINMEVATAIISVVVTTVLILAGIWRGGIRFMRFIDGKFDSIKMSMGIQHDRLRVEIKDTHGRIFSRLDAHDNELADAREAHIILRTKHELMTGGGVHCLRCSQIVSRREIDPPLVSGDDTGIGD